MLSFGQLPFHPLSVCLFHLTFFFAFFSDGSDRKRSLAAAALFLHKTNMTVVFLFSLQYLLLSLSLYMSIRKQLSVQCSSHIKYDCTLEHVRIREKKKKTQPNLTMYLWIFRSYCSFLCVTIFWCK